VVKDGPYFGTYSPIPGSAQKCGSEACLFEKQEDGKMYCHSKNQGENVFQTCTANQSSPFGQVLCPERQIEINIEDDVNGNAFKEHLTYNCSAEEMALHIHAPAHNGFDGGVEMVIGEYGLNMLKMDSSCFIFRYGSFNGDNNYEPISPIDLALELLEIQEEGKMIVPQDVQLEYNILTMDYEVDDFTSYFPNSNEDTCQGASIWDAYHLSITKEQWDSLISDNCIVIEEDDRFGKYYLSKSGTYNSWFWKNTGNDPKKVIEGRFIGVDFSNAEQIFSCVLCPERVIEVEIKDTQTNTTFKERVEYSCSEVDVRAISISAPAHNEFEDDIKVIMNAKEEDAENFTKNRMLKMDSTCFFDIYNYYSFISPVEVALGLEEIQNEGKVQRAEKTEYRMIVVDSKFNITTEKVHPLMEEACSGVPSWNVKYVSITEEQWISLLNNECTQVNDKLFYGWGNMTSSWYWTTTMRDGENVKKRKHDEKIYPKKQGRGIKREKPGRRFNEEKYDKETKQEKSGKNQPQAKIGKTLVEGKIIAVGMFDQDMFENYFNHYGVYGNVYDPDYYNFNLDSFHVYQSPESEHPSNPCYSASTK